MDNFSIFHFQGPAPLDRENQYTSFVSLFNHFSNKPIFRLNSLVDFSPEDFKTMDLVNVLNKQATGIQINWQNLIPIEMHKRVQFGHTLI